MWKVALVLLMVSSGPGSTRGSTATAALPNPVPLQEHALWELLFDNYVQSGGYDSPGEFFHANGLYRRDGGHGAIVFEGRFGFRDGAVCVWGDGLAILCRRVVDNGDGSYTFINTDDGTTATMYVARRR